EGSSLQAALASLITFGLSDIRVNALFVITKSDYRKAWVLKETEKQMEWAKGFEDSCNAQTFRIMTAAVWILAIGLFVLLLILQLWLYSWIPLVVALSVRMFLLAHYIKKSN